MNKSAVLNDCKPAQFNSNFSLKFGDEICKLNNKSCKDIDTCDMHAITTIIIHLERHKSRFLEMEKKIKKTILKYYKYFIAVDCNTDLFKYEFKVINDWIDPISKNKINIGSIACTLSHYYVWKYILDNNIEKCLILEDDTMFYDNFNEEFEKILKLPQQYDLLYLNRNALCSIYGLGKEIEVAENIVIPKYSYNTNAYIITLDGAKKLLNTDLLNNILPVDEFLSIMYDNSYPFTQYSKRFENAIKLKALALKNDITNQEPRTLFQSAIENTDDYIKNT